MVAEVILLMQFYGLDEVYKRVAKELKEKEGKRGDENVLSVIHVDRDTLLRRVKKSVHWYGKVIDKLQGTFLMTVPLAAVKDTLTIPLMASCF